jgi:MSHA biogenesis protein MshO
MTKTPVMIAARGFTLVEAVIVITLTGIIASVVAIFIARPVQGYFDSAQRADMTDTADTALRRIARDLRLALPNGVRPTGVSTAIEFLSTQTGGRYRAATSGAGLGDPLDFVTSADTSFDVFGSSITFSATTATNQNQIVVSNYGITGANAYSGNSASTDVRRAYSGAAGAVSSVSITSVNPLPIDSPSHRFFVVDTPVSYVCNLTAGTLTRYWGYPISVAQAVPPIGASSAVLAQNVSACSFSYAPGITERNGLVAMQLSITKNGETVTLYHEVHVNNAP